MKHTKNIVGKRALCEVLYPGSCAGRGRDRIVYTEDVGGSSPSSPTINPLFSLLFLPVCATLTKWPTGSANL